MREPLVSVIVPARNAAFFVAQALTSVLSQTYTAVEVIIVDDGSTDETFDIANSLADHRVCVMRGKGIGAAAARNIGLQKAQGEFIQYLDSDDVLSPNKVERQLRVLQAAENSVASCAWGGFTTSLDQLLVQPEPVWEVTDPLTWQQVSLSGGGMMQTACWLTPRHVANAAGKWDESLSLHDDGEYFTRVLLHAEQQLFVPDCVVYYRTVPTSLSRRRNRKAIESAFCVCELRHRHIFEFDQSVETRRALATLYGQFAYEFCADAPELVSIAMQRIKDLDDVPADCIGGPLFRAMCRTIGWSAAMWIRKIARSH